MPVGAYGGRVDIMSCIAPDGPVYQAGTLSANPVTLAAGIATLKKLLRPNFYEALEAKTSSMCANINEELSAKSLELELINIGSIFWLRFSKERIFSSDQITQEGINRFKIIHKYLLNNGIYLGPSGYEVGFVSDAHTNEDLKEFSRKLIDAAQLAFNE